jgi:hypothetical protein
MMSRCAETRLPLVSQARGDIDFQMPVLLTERRSVIYSFACRVWWRVALYAVLHDQYIVRIDPRHFTDYHKPLWSIKSPALLAATHAFLASIGPGFLLGIACAVAGWMGSRPRIPDRYVLRGVLLVIVSAEITALLSGLWVLTTGKPFYPDFIFPEETLSLVITQTIQVTCYLASTFFSTVLVCSIWRKRQRMYDVLPTDIVGRQR